MSKMPRHIRLLFAFGLLTLSASTIMRIIFHFSDIAWGTMAGVGIGMELIALVQMLRHKRSLHRNN